MAEFIFLPVPTPEMAEMARDICDARTKARLAAPTVLRNYFDAGAGKGFLRAIGKGCLRGLGGGDTLWLVLHGAGVAGSRVVGADRSKVKQGKLWQAGPGGEKMKKYGTEDVARVLEAEGLPKGFVDLHMLTCGSGLQGGDRPQYVRPIAQRVHEALRARGYDRVRVTGYTGDIRAGAGNCFTVEVSRGGGAFLVDPSQAVMAFG